MAVKTFICKRLQTSEMQDMRVYNPISIKLFHQPFVSLCFKVRIADNKKETYLMDFTAKGEMIKDSICIKQKLLNKK
jgi:hypothetical protein